MRFTLARLQLRCAKHGRVMCLKLVGVVSDSKFSCRQGAFEFLKASPGIASDGANSNVPVRIRAEPAAASKREYSQCRNTIWRFQYRSIVRLREAKSVKIGCIAVHSFDQSGNSPERGTLIDPNSFMIYRITGVVPLARSFETVMASCEPPLSDPR